MTPSRNPTQAAAAPRRWGHNLRDLRRQTGKRMRAFAALVDCSYRHLQLIETQERRMSVDLAWRVAGQLSRELGRPVHPSEFTDVVEAPAEESESA